MKHYHVEFDIEIREYAAEADGPEEEVPVSLENAAAFEEALRTEIEGLVEMDFDLEISEPSGVYVEDRSPYPVQEVKGIHVVVN
jgi:hypothetical protein